MGPLHRRRVPHEEPFMVLISPFISKSAHICSDSSVTVGIAVSVSQLTALVQSELSRHLLDGLPLTL